jgi:nitroimidazol reductase NimA-like FMN-containing flavoprotein (pyridoxamine 5'-phosphate oxidase superfamily)
MATEVLTHDECMALLETQPVGRLAVVAGRYPFVVPVNFAVDHGIIVFRTGPGTKLDAASHQNVAFQVDEIDPVQRSGWSVLVTGMAEVVTDRHDDGLSQRSHDLPIDPYEGGEKDRWVRILPSSVTGRRISPGDLPPPFDARGYL